MPKRAHSRYFANAMKSLIETDFENNNAEFARAIGSTSSVVAYYTRPGSDGRFPSVEALGRILDKLKPKHRKILLEAYLLDMVPAKFADLVKIGDGATKKASGREVPLPPDCEQALATLRAHAVESSKTRRWLIATAQAMFDME